MLGFQVDIKKKYELWSLVGPQPELTSFWEMLGVHVEAGPSTQEIIASFERYEGWSRDDRKRLAYLAIFTGYIEGRKYSTPTRVSLARLVMELERFENYPWGRVAFKVLMDSVKGRDILGCHTINGFAQALQVWVYTALPELGANYGKPFPNNPSPPILAYKGHKGRRQFKETILKASEEVHTVARSEVNTTVGGLTKEDIKTMFKDIVDAMREGFGTCLKEIKYLSERVEAVEKKVGITTKRKGTSSQSTTSPPKPTLEPGLKHVCFVYSVDFVYSESVNGTNAGRKSLPEDKSPDVPANASSSKDKAPEASLVLLDKNQPTVSDLQKEDARYQERRDVALTFCRTKSDRTRKLAASQQSPYTANSTAKVIIPNKKLYPGYNLFAPIDKNKLKELADWLKACPHYRIPLDKKPRTSRTWWYHILRTSLEWLEDCHIYAWINLLRKRYDANPQHFRSERMCFLDHLFSQQRRFNYKDFKDSEPD
uniref:DUF1985 domain-containing protein n=1 Tax=Brassica oleracea var. oleracea TaxID=109376 RepID=A0A0D3CT61_BRAOL